MDPRKHLSDAPLQAKASFDRAKEQVSDAWQTIRTEPTQVARSGAVRWLMLVLGASLGGWAVASLLGSIVLPGPAAVDAQQATVAVVCTDAQCAAHAYATVALDFDDWPLTCSTCSEPTAQRATRCATCRGWRPLDRTHACHTCAQRVEPTEVESAPTKPTNPDDAEDPWG